MKEVYQGLEKYGVMEEDIVRRRAVWKKKIAEVKEISENKENLVLLRKEKQRVFSEEQRGRASHNGEQQKKFRR